VRYRATYPDATVTCRGVAPSKEQDLMWQAAHWPGS
jgi:hypothetical protein